MLLIAEHRIPLDDQPKTTHMRLKHCIDILQRNNKSGGYSRTGQFRAEQQFSLGQHS